MKIELKEISVREVVEGYIDDNTDYILDKKRIVKQGSEAPLA